MGNYFSLFACWAIFYAFFLSFADFFFKINFLKNFLNVLDPDQDRSSWYDCSYMNAPVGAGKSGDYFVCAWFS